MSATKEGYPASDFLVVEDAEKATTFHLQVKRHGTPDHGLMGAAFAALYKNYRGNSYEGPNKEEAKTKLRALYKAEGMDWPSETASEGSMEGPRFVVLLKEPPATGLVRIPIAVTGAWAGAEQKFSIQLEDLQQIRENFAKKPTGEINVDYEHASEVPFGTGGPVLSAGRITKLDAPEHFADGKKNQSESLPSAERGGEGTQSDKAGENGDGRYILWGWYEPTERARQLISNREYRYISPAIRWGTKDKVTGKTAGTALTSVALVNKPFLEELPEIHLCEVEEVGVRSQESGEVPRTFVSLQQLHVPGPVNQISVAYQQPGNQRPGRARPEDKTMAKNLKLKCLTEAHLEKHKLPADQKGKIGVFDGDELMGVAEGPEGWAPKGDPDEEKTKACELFASEVGMAGKNVVDIAQAVKLAAKYIASPGAVFDALEPVLKDGRIMLGEAADLADQGRLKFATVVRAQQAETRVNEAIKTGRLLGKNRAIGLKLALCFSDAFATLVEAGKPVVDLRTLGHAGAGEDQPVTAQQEMMTEVNAYVKEHNCSAAVALSEVTKKNPGLWTRYNAEIVVVSGPGAEEEE